MALMRIGIAKVELSTVMVMVMLMLIRQMPVVRLIVTVVILPAAMVVLAVIVCMRAHCRSWFAHSSYKSKSACFWTYVFLPANSLASCASLVARSFLGFLGMSVSREDLVQLGLEERAMAL